MANYFSRLWQRARRGWEYVDEQVNDPFGRAVARAEEREMVNRQRMAEYEERIRQMQNDSLTDSLRYMQQASNQSAMWENNWGQMRVERPGHHAVIGQSAQQQAAPQPFSPSGIKNGPSNRSSNRPYRSKSTGSNAKWRSNRPSKCSAPSPVIFTSRGSASCQIIPHPTMPLFWLVTAMPAMLHTVSFDSTRAILMSCSIRWSGIFSGYLREVKVSRTR